jgi:hypothetical protein
MDEPEGGSEQQQAQTNTPESGSVQSGHQEEVPTNPDNDSADKQKVAKPLWWKAMSGPDWITAIATVMIFFATALYVYYAKKQWKTMDAQLGVMSSQLKEIQSGSKDTHDLAEAAKTQAEQAKAQTIKMAESLSKTDNLIQQTRRSADAARQAAHIADKTLVATQRPWLKIKHRIISPLTFNVGGRASGIPVAMMKIEDTIENVGQTVAVNVLSWEDVIPMDPDGRTTTAEARQKEWCDANRHPHGLPGYTLFPHDPFVGGSVVGPEMPKVEAARSPDIDGKVGFVLVGCVCYRASFESQNSPTHQTRFLYYLGRVGAEVGFNPYVVPSGVAADLQLIAIPRGFSAD